MLCFIFLNSKNRQPAPRSPGVLNCLVPIFQHTHDHICLASNRRRGLKTYWSPLRKPSLLRWSPSYPPPLENKKNRIETPRPCLPGLQIGFSVHVDCVASLSDGKLRRKARQHLEDRDFRQLRHSNSVLPWNLEAHAAGNEFS